MSVDLTEESFARADHKEIHISIDDEDKSLQKKFGDDSQSKEVSKDYLKEKDLKMFGEEQGDPSEASQANADNVNERSSANPILSTILKYNMKNLSLKTNIT